MATFVNVSKKVLASLVVIGWGLLVLTGGYYFTLLRPKSKSFPISSPPKKRAIVKAIVIPHDTTALECLNYALRKLDNSDSMRSASLGFCLATADSGEVLLDWNAKQTFVPASVMKILTTGICLEKLG